MDSLMQSALFVCRLPPNGAIGFREFAAALERDRIALIVDTRRNKAAGATWASSAFLERRFGSEHYLDNAGALSARIVPPRMPAPDLDQREGPSPNAHEFARAQKARERVFDDAIRELATRVARGANFRVLLLGVAGDPVLSDVLTALREKLPFFVLELTRHDMARPVARAHVSL